MVQINGIPFENVGDFTIDPCRIGQPTRDGAQRLLISSGIQGRALPA
jgi:hypothetical protein